jgi:hypothetical protein
MEPVNPSKPMPYGFTQDDDDSDIIPAHPLDSTASKEKESRLREWFHQVLTTTFENRMQQCIDCDFHDGIQWHPEDAKVLTERGQAPLVFNVIAQHVRWILGTERRTRVDYKIHGRGKEDLEGAQTKTKLMKYTDDVNKAAYARSMAFSDMVRSGMGWMETGIRSDPGDEPLFDRWESWRNMYLDPLSKEPDISDARYLFRSKWVDEDIALAMFPDRESAIKESAVSHELYNSTEDDDLGFTGLYNSVPGGGGGAVHESGTTSVSGDSFSVGSRRRRIRLLECWYREPEQVQVVRPHLSGANPDDFNRDLMSLSGQEVGANDPSMQLLEQNGHISVYDAVRMKVHCAVLCNKGLLQDKPSPYKHAKFPFTPIWGFRRDSDNQPYGAIRQMRDPQEDLNKRRSKALFILSTRRVIADEDAVEDWDELEDQVSRPDGIIKKTRGSEIEIQDDTSLAKEHVSLMLQDQQFLETTSGVTEENRGEVTNAISGKAINLRQTQGSVVTADLFDNLRQAIQLHGEKKLSLIEQYYDEPKIFRITNDRGQPDHQQINMNDGMGNITNDITMTQADYIVDTVDHRESVRLAMFDSMMNVIGQLDPQVQLQLLDMVIELADMPNRDEMVRRIRELNGQIDPDAPDVDAQRAARDKAKDEEADLERRGKEAKILTDESRAAKTMSDAARAESETMFKAQEIAEKLAMNPGMAAAMDEFFASFQEQASATEVSQSTVQANIPPPAPGITEPQAMPMEAQVNGE